MVALETCCCKFPLREGSLAIAVLDLLSMCVYFKRIFGFADENDPQGNRSVAIIIALIIILHIISGIIGILKRIPKYILLYVICSWIRLTIVGIDMILLFLFSHTIVVDVSKDYQIQSIAICGAWATHVYYTLVVYSYYKQVKHGGQLSALVTVV